MLAGHYAAAYALRSHSRLPLWALFLAVQAVDVVFFVFAVTGIETMRVVSGDRGPLAMHLVHIPYTHSLALNLAYAGGLMALGAVTRHVRLGVVAGLALLSHWMLDLFVHLWDLPITVEGTRTVGLGLWRYPAFAFLLETALVLAAYSRLRNLVSGPAARRWLDVTAVVLVLIQTIYVFGPPPTTVLQMAIAAEAIYLVMTLLAYQVDRRSTRQPFSSSR